MMRRKEVTPEEWIKHKKLCKKRASAKWYLKKRAKELEIRDQQDAQRKKQQRHMEEGTHPDWTDEQRLVWRCDLYRRIGWPARPSHIPPQDWIHLVEVATKSFQHMTQHEYANIPGTDKTKRDALIKGMLMAELVRGYDTHGLSTVQQAAEPVMSRVDPPPVGSAFRPVFPWLCSALGLVFVRLALQGKLHLWPLWLQSTGESWPSHNPQHNQMIHQPIQSDCEQVLSRNKMAPIQMPTVQDIQQLYLIAGKNI